MNSTTIPINTESWVPAGRRLVLVDIENVVGGSGVSRDDVAAALATITTVVRPTANDVLVTACGPRLLGTAMSVLGSSVRLGRGIDGADARLAEFLETDKVRGRYASVVLASGDSAAFAASVRHLAEIGVPTDLVLGLGRVGAELYIAARSAVSLFDAPPNSPDDQSFALAA
jgi:hypothetical protein